MWTPTERKALTCSQAEEVGRVVDLCLAVVSIQVPVARVHFVVDPVAEVDGEEAEENE